MSDPEIINDDFAPRAATDRGPLDCSPEILRAQYARHFQTCAERFRALPLAYEGPQNIKLATECGQSLIQAYDRGLLPEIPELHELIRWHTAAPKPTERKPPPVAVYVRCPANLFWDLAGGNAVEARNVGGKLFFLLDEFGNKKRTGGLLPRMVPGLLELPDNERYAYACLILADLLKANSPSTVARSKEEKLRQLRKLPPVAGDPPSGQGERPEAPRPANPPAGGGKPPPDEVWQAWRMRHQLGKTQTEIAALLTIELKRPIDQSMVSRWLKKADEALGAGHKPPELTTPKTRAMDPEVIDRGPRVDGRTSRQRDRFEKD